MHLASWTPPHPHYIHNVLAEGRPGFSREEPFCSNYVNSFSFFLVCAEAEAHTTNDFKFVIDVLHIQLE